MCARFTLSADPADVAEVLGIADPTALPPLPPRYNVAPTQPILTAGRNAAGVIAAGFMKWGLVPSWATDDKGGTKLLNARAEGVALKPSFRDAFRKRRCLVPASGFYEWRAEGKRKQPYHFRRPDGKPFLFAGLWERWGGDLLTCCIITTEANGIVGPVHNRMPVILTPEDVAAWTNPRFPVEALCELLKPAPDDFLAAVAVSTRVNSPKNEGPQCIDPLTAS